MGAVGMMAWAWLGFHAGPDRPTLADALRADPQARHLTYGLEQVGVLDRLGHPAAFFTVFIAPDASWPDPLWRCVTQPNHRQAWQQLMGYQVSLVHWRPRLTSPAELWVQSWAGPRLRLGYPVLDRPQVNGLPATDLQAWANGHTLRIPHPLLPPPERLEGCEQEAQRAEAAWALGEP